MLRVLPHPTAMRALSEDRRFARLERETVDAVDRFGEITKIDLPSTFLEDVAGKGSTRCASPVILRTEGRHRIGGKERSDDSTAPRLAVDTHARCRRCGPCLRAKMIYWASAALEQTRLSQEAGRRSWFGTFTLSGEWQLRFAERAADRYPYSEPSWEDVAADRRYRLICDEVYKEVQRYWKRLRKRHQLRYLVVFERHKSGLPHLHALIHEVSAPILKRQLQAEWSFGYTKMTVVGGPAARAAGPEKAAWYVAKYLSKEAMGKLVASQNYRPQARLIAPRHL